jgi:hypothetical protein
VRDHSKAPVYPVSDFELGRGEAKP